MLQAFSQMRNCETSLQRADSSKALIKRISISASNSSAVAPRSLKRTGIYCYLLPAISLYTQPFALLPLPLLAAASADTVIAATRYFSVQFNKQR